MKYSLLKYPNQDKNLVKNELEKIFDKYNVKLNILQYKEIKDNKFYPGYIEYFFDDNDKGYKSIEKILNKYGWEFFFYYGDESNKDNFYKEYFPIYEEME